MKTPRPLFYLADPKIFWYEIFIMTAEKRRINEYSKGDSGYI